MKPPRTKIKGFELRDAGITSEYWHLTLDDYVASPTIKAKVRRYLDKLPAMHRDGIGLILLGDTTTGKTMISSVIAKEYLKWCLTARMTTLTLMTNMLAQGWRNEDVKDEFNETILESDLLVIDDVGKDFTNALVKQCFDMVVRHRCAWKKPTILSSNQTIDDLKERYGETMGGLFERKFIELRFPSADAFREKLKKRHETRLDKEDHDE